jgi:hypothetical protein
MMGLVDAMCSQSHAKSVVELSLESCFRRSYSAIFKALENYKPGEEDLANLAGPELPIPEQRNFWLLGVDVTPQPRSYAQTLKEQGFCVSTKCYLWEQTDHISHQYSTVALLPEKDKAHPAPWVVPLSVKRVNISEKKAMVGAAQIGTLLGNENLPFAGQLCVEVSDSDYSQPACLAANREHYNFITIVRSRGNRVYYRKASRISSGGAPKHYGETFCLKKPATWHSPDAETTLPFTSRRGRSYQVSIQAWHNMLMRGKNKPKRIRMHLYPFTLVRIILLDDDQKPVFRHPLWLLVVGEQRHQLALPEIYQSYTHHSDLEHFFRFGKQKLLLTHYQTPVLAREESWWHLVHLAYLQLWVVRNAASTFPDPGNATSQFIWPKFLPLL